VSGAKLGAHRSHDTLRRVLSQKVPWSRRRWEACPQTLVHEGGSRVSEDTSWERVPRVAEAGRGVGGDAAQE